MNLGHISFSSSLHTHSEHLKDETTEGDALSISLRSQLSLSASCNDEATSSRTEADEQKTNTGPLVFRVRLAVVCCIALIHVELRIQEHHRLISHSVTFCENLETEILQKVRQNYERWKVQDSGRHWQATKGKFLTM